MKQDRLKSKVVWVAALAQLTLILALILTPEDLTTVKVVGGAIIEIATLYGILNNPTDKNSF